MSKRAEEIALKKYPVDICGYTVECRVGATPQPQDWNEERRKCFQQGYEQAEKDIALTWEDMQRIVEIYYTLHDSYKGNSNIYNEVLRRFNKVKEDKK